MKTEVRISGLGGQGVVLAGQILGKAAVYDGKNVVQTQSYGAEARGSLAKSEVIISDHKISFPAVRKCDILLAMNQDAVDAYVKDLKDDGVLIIDSTYVKENPETKAKLFKIAATETTEKIFGTKVYANMIMLGALLKATNAVSEKALEAAIEDTVSKEAVELNQKAFSKGRELVS